MSWAQHGVSNYLKHYSRQQLGIYCISAISAATVNVVESEWRGLVN